ncbi:hypothetical protein ACSTLJ_04760 [Vibrio parahaemolyticus]|nr:hypothetical protein [Vibrio parahaemolyticus]
MNSFNPNLEQIQYLLQNDPETRDFFERKTVSDYNSFVRVLNKDLKNAIQRMQHDRHQYQDLSFGEDALTSVLINSLQALNYDAEHDTQHGGHCDILVKHQSHQFEWIGEAKLWKGPAYIKGGLEQLLNRYATATSGESAGGMLVYVRQPNALSKLRDWHSELSGHPSTLSIADLPEIPRELQFDSVQTATASGLPYDVKHHFVSLYHATSIEPEYSVDGLPIDS